MSASRSHVLLFQPRRTYSTASGEAKIPERETDSPLFNLRILINFYEVHTPADVIVGFINIFLLCI
jgi:hypothetical protein